MIIISRHAFAKNCKEIRLRIKSAKIYRIYPEYIKYQNRLHSLIFLYFSFVLKVTAFTIRGYKLFGVRSLLRSIWSMLQKQVKEMICLWSRREHGNACEISWQHYMYSDKSYINKMQHIILTSIKYGFLLFYFLQKLIASHTCHSSVETDRIEIYMPRLSICQNI